MSRYPGDIAAALKWFDQQRRPQGAAVVTRARELGAYMQAQVLSADQRALAEKYRQPMAVIAETAVPLRSALR